MENSKSTRTRTMLVVGLVLLLGGFLLGFVPQFQHASRLQENLTARDQRVTQLQREARLSKARELVSLLYLELTRKNFGVATKHATTFFDHLRDMRNDETVAAMRGELDAILSQRDRVISEIAQSDPAAATHVSELLERMHSLVLPQ